ncbi:hypothetical protein [Spartinivicinus poritis]|uniref:Uncharacterized protein n=1 Tax=Spartinivicinus poritis TaxID=2994640 RepID=A0ABT5UGQ9_9GAMM|nr:hypothetical protein [Spartinivicinus sp. A2-2]MDE1465561.1 hypothetical protein [Spartinivicinus sp. A2-2]
MYYNKLSAMLTVFLTSQTVANQVEIYTYNNYIGERTAVSLELENSKPTPVEITIKQLTSKSSQTDNTYKIQYPAIFHSSLEVKKLDHCDDNFEFTLDKKPLRIQTHTFSIETNRVTQYDCPAYNIEITGNQLVGSKYMPVYRLSNSFTREGVIFEKNGIDPYSYEQLYNVVGNNKNQGFCASNIAPAMEITAGKPRLEDETLIKIQPSIVIKLEDNYCISLKNNKFVFKEYYYSTPDAPINSTKILENSENRVKNEVKKLLSYYGIEQQ